VDVGNMAGSRDDSYRRRVLLLDGAAIVGCAIYVLCAQRGVLGPVSLPIPLFYWIALGLLVAGEWLAWRERYFAATPHMCLGGIGTLPIDRFNSLRRRGLAIARGRRRFR
jgi:hypothetical protein